MDALGPTPIPDNGKKIKEDFKSFLEKLSKKSPNLSKEEILEKMILWIESQSDSQLEQASIVRQVNLVVHPDKPGMEYLKKASPEDNRFYFIGIQAAFERMEKADLKTLQKFYNMLHTDWTNEKALNTHHFSASVFFEQIKVFIATEASTQQEQKLLARRIARHLALTPDQMFNSTNGFDLEMEPELEPAKGLIAIPEADQNKIGISFFKEKVSDKDYKIYFKNLEKEGAPPEGFFAKLRFDYVNELAFAGRVFKYDTWSILKGAIAVALAVPIALSTIVFVIGVSELGLVAAVALFAAEAASIQMALAVVAASSFVLSLPLIAGGLHSDNPLNGYLFPIKMLLLTPVAAISSFVSYLTKKSESPGKIPEPVVDEAEPDAEPPKLAKLPKNPKDNKDKKNLSVIVEEPELEPKAEQEQSSGQKLSPRGSGNADAVD